MQTCDYNLQCESAINCHSGEDCKELWNVIYTEIRSTWQLEGGGEPNHNN